MLVWYYYTGLVVTNKCLYCTITQDQPNTQYMLVRYDYPKLSGMSKCFYGTITLDRLLPINACTVQLH